MIRINRFLLFLFFAFSIPAFGEDLHIAAPVSLKSLLTEVNHFFEQKNPNWKVDDLYDNPSEIVHQIRGAAPLDVVIVDEGNLADVKEAAEFQPEQRLFSNDVVIIAVEESDLVWEDVKKAAAEDPEKMKKLAVLDDSTILGKATREYLKKIGLSNLPTEKLVNVKKPKGAIESVKNDEVKLAIIFSTDAARAKKLKILARLPSSDIPGQVYYATVPKSAKHLKAAETYLQTFQSSIIQQMIRNAGLTLASQTQ